jgi:hypothetical protein
MPLLSCDDPCFSDVAWKFKFQPSKHTDSSIGHAGPFANAF